MKFSGFFSPVSHAPLFCLRKAPRSVHRGGKCCA